MASSASVTSWASRGMGASPSNLRRYVSTMRLSDLRVNRNSEILFHCGFAFTQSEKNHPPRDPARKHVGIRLVDLVQRVGFRDEWIEVQLFVQIKIQQHWEITTGVNRAVVGSLDGFLLSRKDGAGEVGAGAHGRQAGD